jgi:hypothetical protein
MSDVHRTPLAVPRQYRHSTWIHICSFDDNSEYTVCVIQSLATQS